VATCRARTTLEVIGIGHPPVAADGEYVRRVALSTLWRDEVGKV
jgi:hypothetical protein